MCVCDVSLCVMCVCVCVLLLCCSKNRMSFLCHYFVYFAPFKSGIFLRSSTSRLGIHGHSLFSTISHFVKVQQRLIKKVLKKFILEHIT